MAEELNQDQMQDQNQTQSSEITKVNESELLSFNDDTGEPEISDPLQRLDLEERKNKEKTDFAAHRCIYPNSFNGPAFVWDTPFLQKQPDQDFAEFPNMSRNTANASDIVGVIGVFTKAHYGFIYWGGEDDEDEEDTETANGNKGPKCKTVASYVRHGEDEKLEVDDMPLPFPVRQPHQSKSKPDQYVKDLKQKKSHLTLYGSRAPFDEEGNVIDTGYDPSEPITVDNIDKRFRTCESCVHFRDHFSGELNKKGEIKRSASKCGFNGEFKFVVFALAVKEEDPNGEEQIVWYRPEDYEVETLTGPFVARCSINKTTGLTNIGKGDFRVDINYDENPLADQQVVSFPSYYQTMRETSSRIQEIDGQVIYNFLTMITPVGVRKDDPQEGGANHVPVFKHLIGGHFDNCLIRNNVAQLAYDIEQAEIRAANGESVMIPNQNPVFDALKAEGFNCYDPDDDNGDNGHAKAVSDDDGPNGDGSQPKQVEAEVTQSQGETAQPPQDKPFFARRSKSS